MSTTMDNLEKIAIYEKGLQSQFVDEEFKELMRDKIRELSITKPFYAKDEILKEVFPSLKQNDIGYYIPSSANDDKYIIKKAKEKGVDIEVVNRYNDGTDLYDVYINLLEPKAKKEKVGKFVKINEEMPSGLTIPKQKERDEAQQKGKEFLEKEKERLSNPIEEPKVQSKEEILEAIELLRDLPDNEETREAIELLKDLLDDEPTFENGGKIGSKWDGRGTDVYSFVKGDEVYRKKDKEPFGMVVGIGSKKIKVQRHSDSKEVSLEPSKLYLGKNLHLRK
jgi:hypothetical protein